MTPDPLPDTSKQATIIYLEPELREQLAALGEANGRSLSQEGRIAVREYVRVGAPPGA